MTNTEHTLPIINIVVIDHDTQLSDKLIRYWLSLGLDAPVAHSVYSKIFWVEANPIQINIYDLNSAGGSTLELPVCHAILHLVPPSRMREKSVSSEAEAASASPLLVHTTESSITPQSLASSNEHTYECVLVLNTLEHAGKPTATSHELEYYTSSLTSAGLPTVLDSIMRSAFKAARQAYQDHQPTSSSVLAIPEHHTSTPIPSHIYCIEDDFYFLDSPTITKESCCSLL